MDLSDIGTLAGKTWKYLSKNGESPALKIRADLRLSNTNLFLAIGWLAREDKVNISAKNNDIFFSLKNK